MVPESRTNSPVGFEIVLMWDSDFNGNRVTLEVFDNKFVIYYDKIRLQYYDELKKWIGIDKQSGKVIQIEWPSIRDIAQKISEQLNA